MVLWRALANVVVKSFRPNVVTAVKIGPTPVDQETVLSVSAFFAAFIGLFFFGSLFMAILGYGISMGLDVDCGCFGPEDPESKAFHGLRAALYRDGQIHNESYADDPLNPFYNQEHIPGANSRGTNFIVTPDLVYVLQGITC